MRSARSTVWAVAAACLLGACESDSSSKPGPGDKPVEIAKQAHGPLEALLQSYQYEAIRPPRGDYGPGTVLTPDGVKVLAFNAFPAESISRSQPVAFLRNYREVVDVADSAELLLALGAKDVAGVKATLSSGGVSKIDVTLGDCVADVLPLLPAQQAIGAFPDSYKKAIAGGAPVIVEAIRVGTASISFVGDQGTNVALSTEGVAKVLAKSSVSRDSKGSVSYLVATSEPVYIGMKTQEFTGKWAPAKGRREYAIYVDVKGLYSNSLVADRVKEAVASALTTAGFAVAPSYFREFEVELAVGFSNQWKVGEPTKRDENGSGEEWPHAFRCTFEVRLGYSKVTSSYADDFVVHRYRASKIEDLATTGRDVIAAKAVEHVRQVLREHGVPDADAPPPR